MSERDDLERAKPVVPPLREIVMVSLLGFASGVVLAALLVAIVRGELVETLLYPYRLVPAPLAWTVIAGAVTVALLALYDPDQ